MHKQMSALVVAMLLVLPASAIQAKDKSKNKSEYHKASVVEMADNKVRVSVGFNDSERNVLSNWQTDTYRSDSHKKHKKLPKGLEKKLARGGDLPPGWQKKLQRGEVMSREIYQRSRPLPPEIVRELPRAPQGTILVELDGDIVRLAEASLTIIDVLKRNR